MTLRLDISKITLSETTTDACTQAMEFQNRNMELENVYLQHDCQCFVLSAKDRRCLAKQYNHYLEALLRHLPQSPSITLEICSVLTQSLAQEADYLTPLCQKNYIKSFTTKEVFSKEAFPELHTLFYGRNPSMCYTHITRAAQTTTYISYFPTPSPYDLSTRLRISELHIEGCLGTLDLLLRQCRDLKQLQLSYDTVGRPYTERLATDLVNLPDHMDRVEVICNPENLKTLSEDVNRLSLLTTIPAARSVEAPLTLLFPRADLPVKLPKKLAHLTITNCEFARWWHPSHIETWAQSINTYMAITMHACKVPSATSFQIERGDSILKCIQKLPLEVRLRIQRLWAEDKLSNCSKYTRAILASLVVGLNTKPLKRIHRLCYASPEYCYDEVNLGVQFSEYQKMTKSVIQRRHIACDSHVYDEERLSQNVSTKLSNFGLCLICKECTQWCITKPWYVCKFCNTRQCFECHRTPRDTSHSVASEPSPMI